MDIKFSCSCGQRLAVNSEAAGQQFPCPSCGLILTVSEDASSASASESSLEEDPSRTASEEFKQPKKSRSRLAKLTAETIRQRTKRGAIPLHGAAKNGKLDEIPRELLTVDLFLVQNSEGETALHVAARNGTLDHVPAEFFTEETLSVMEMYGRTPLHLAAKFDSLNQIPRDALTLKLLGIKTHNEHRSSVVHVAARNNNLGQIPRDLLTPELMDQRNAYGETPLQALENNRATASQWAYLQDLGVVVEAGSLTKYDASLLIEKALYKNTSDTTLKTDPARNASAPPLQSPYFTNVDLIQGTPEWLSWRNNGIGASDAPTIMGENPWKTAAQLLSEKCGKAPESAPNSAMVRGTELEPEARRAYELRTGRIMEPACLQSTQYEWLRASLDGLSQNLDTAVEIKCGDSVYRKTADYGKVPSYYYGQLQHILAVTGLLSMDFFCYLPDRPALLVPVERDDTYIERLVIAEYQIWMEVLQGRGARPGLVG
jgi:putative phage-type endonuclease